MQFDGTQEEIGVGAQAIVYRYKGFAYKVYKASYRTDWIQFEKQQQIAVNEAGLCHVKYYDTEDDHIIKMDLVEGDTLEKKLREGYMGGFELLTKAFRKVHGAKCDNVNMPQLIYTATMGLNDEDRMLVEPILDRMFRNMPKCICHLDLHFLNIMIPSGTPGQIAGDSLADIDDYVIIDWMNARIAPAVFDYARTYVILEEFAKEILEDYMNSIAADLAALKIIESDFADAVTVCRILRKQEKK